MAKMSQKLLIYEYKQKNLWNIYHIIDKDKVPKIFISDAGIGFFPYGIDHCLQTVFAKQHRHFHKIFHSICSWKINKIHSLLRKHFNPLWVSVRAKNVLAYDTEKRCHYCLA